MEEKKLRFPTKIAYGLGDFGGNFFAMFIGSFILMYLADGVGLNTGIIGTLMLVSKIFDGVTDVIIGTLIDHTKTKWGKARPWMFYSTFLTGISIILIYNVPLGMGKTAQYAYFFVVYTLANAIFYTANSISYSTLCALITRKTDERVQLGTIRYFCAMTGIMVISIFTTSIVTAFGGGAVGWRNTAILYAAIFIVMNLIAVLSVRELPEEVKEENKENNTNNSTSISFGQTMKTLLTNRYFIFTLLIYILFYTWQGVLSSVGVFFMKVVLGNPAMLGTFTMAQMIPMLASLTLTPIAVKKFGMYKTTLCAAICISVASLIFAVCGMSVNVIGMLIAMACTGLFCAPIVGCLNAIIANIGSYIYLKKGVHVESSLYSCSSVGIKVGGGLASVAAGWGLSIAGYNGALAVQAASTVTSIKILYAVTPLVAFVLLTLCFTQLNIDKELNKLKEEKGIEE